VPNLFPFSCGLNRLPVGRSSIAEIGMFGRLQSLFIKNPAVKSLGPGLITGAADDDPSGIATYSQAGAQFGLNMLWTVVLTYPFMIGIQLASARIGRVTGKGLAANIRRSYSPWLLYCIVLLLLIANIINIAADIAAMGEAMRMVMDKGSAHYYSLAFGFICLSLQIFLPYRKYVSYLKWLTLGLLAYVASMFTVRIPWSDVILHTIWPTFQWNNASVTMIVAVFGTTISPYLFFWQASQEVEELRADASAKALRRGPTDAASHLNRMKADTFIGMGFSNLIAFSIILITAVTLATHGITNIQTSAQAADALRPLAGEFAFVLFALGIIGTGLLAVPVLAGSAAYAVTESFRWRNGLDLKALEAREFYAIISLATVGGMLLNFTPIDPIKALFWSALINGVIAVPIMIVMMLLARKPHIMGKFTLSRRHTILGWIGVAIMAAAVVGMFVTM
jgi:NRAMP (natural resistance-associated macrophage protein)-like metal ion transporter